MRLLRVEDLAFVEFLDGEEPSYAIASHRWCSDEATFRDVRDGCNTDTQGYRKVQAFAEYVEQHLPQIKWLWIDTCCINKDSDAELSYSINSMFKWYRRAAICVVYMEDVEVPDDRTSFESSVWFTRGWTLQELLAPSLAVFVTQSWQVVGHKGSLGGERRVNAGRDLADEIARITGIPVSVLHDYTTSRALTAKEKLVWMNRRTTTRPEDMSYALYGILGVTLGANYGEGFEGARQRLLTAVYPRETPNLQHAERDEPQRPKDKQPWRLPRQAAGNYSGYTDISTKLEHCILGSHAGDEQVVIVLSGMGGVGKSESVLQFLKKHNNALRKSFWAVFWVDCTSEATTRADFKSIGNLCGWDTDDSDLLYGVKDRLASHDRQCLLLLDNCDDPTTNFGNYIPSGPQVSVILTTRLSDASKYASLDPQDANRRLCLRLDGLDTASAAELILEASQVHGRSDMAAQQAARRQAGHIAEFLDCHPLAIVIASSLLQSTAYSLEELAESLKDRLTQKELLDTSTEQATYQRVSATFEMSVNVLQKLAASDPSARDALDLLDLLGFMHHQGLSEDVFVRAWNHEEEVLSNCLKKDREPQYLSMWHVTQSRKYFPYGSSDVRKRALLKARAHLIRLTLVKQNLEDNTIYLHALVHLWAKERLKHPTKPWAAAASILALSGEGSQGWEPYSPQLSLHCETNFRAMQNSKGIDLHGEAICKIWCNFAWQMVFCHHPHCSDVVSHFSSEVELTCRTTANDLLATEPQFFLAVLALRDGEASHAAAVLEDVVKVRARLDERHPWRLSSEHELACAYSADGRNSEAIKIFEHVLQRQDNLAEDHPGRLETQHELAGTYLDDGSISKAIAILEHVVYTRKNLPVDHRELLSSQHELARAYLEDEQFDRAIEILERVVAARKISLAIDHPDRLTSQHVLAAAYLETGRSSEAVKIFKHVVRTRSKLAASHPRRLDAQHELARAYLEDDRTSKAIDMYTYVVNVRSKLPATHPDRLVSQHELARAYWCNNQFEEADELMSYVVDMRQRALPEGHRDRILSEEVLEKIRNDEDNPAAVSKGRADFADWQLDYTD